MQFTILGSGSPIPHTARAGTSIALSVGTDDVLIDCGPGTVERMIQQEIHPATFEDLFFTHQHMDHNASFFHFVISGWILGRRSLDIYGPEGTERLTDALETVYEEDFEYRSSLGRPLDGLTDIKCHLTGEGYELDRDGWSVRTIPVEHSIETHAYRFDEDSGASFVFSGDTRKVDYLSEFAEGADVLVHDCPWGPAIDEFPTDQLVFHQQIDPAGQYKRGLREVHANATEAAEVAEAAGVDTLILTHLLPFRDTAAIRAEAEREFGGTVLTAEDGLTLSSPF